MTSKLKHTFDVLPEVGAVLEDNGFAYSVISARPHKNKFGDESMVVTLEGTCAEAGCKFHFTVGRSIYNLPRRCTAHNKGWSKARPWRDPGAAELAPRATIATASSRSDVEAFIKRVEKAAKAGELEGLEDWADLLWLTWADLYNVAEMRAEVEARQEGYDSVAGKRNSLAQRREADQQIAARQEIARRYEEALKAPVEIRNVMHEGDCLACEVNTPHGWVRVEGDSQRLKQQRPGADVSNNDKTSIWGYISRRWAEIVAAAMFA